MGGQADQQIDDVGELEVEACETREIRCGCTTAIERSVTAMVRAEPRAIRRDLQRDAERGHHLDAQPVRPLDRDDFLHRERVARTDVVHLSERPKRLHGRGTFVDAGKQRIGRDRRGGYAAWLFGLDAQRRAPAEGQHDDRDESEESARAHAPVRRCSTTPILRFSRST